MQRIGSAVAISLLIITAAWGASVVLPGAVGDSCLSRADVDRHLDRSRNGISLTCNEQVRRANAQQAESGGRHVIH